MSNETYSEARARWEKAIAEGGSVLFHEGEQVWAEGRKVISNIGNVITWSDGSIDRFVTNPAELQTEEAWNAERARGLERAAVWEAERREQGWLPSEECSCRILTHALEGWERLPDHICPTNYQDICEAWVREHLKASGAKGPLVMAFGDRFIHANDPKQWPLVFVNGHGLGSLDVNRAGHIYLVLRQWVEEESDALGRELLSLPAVQQKARHQRSNEAATLFDLGFSDKGERKAELDRRHDALLSAWAQYGSAPTDATYQFRHSGEDVEAFRAKTLPGLGVPCTPGTARFLMACTLDLFPNPPLVPTRGVLVTSLLVQPPHYPRYPGDFAEHIYQTSGSSLWDSVTLRRAAADMVEQHREWLRRVDEPELKAFRAGKFFAGQKPKDPALECDIDNFLAGQITQDEVCARALKRFSKGKIKECRRPPTADELDKKQKAVKRRIRNRQKQHN